LTQFTDLGLSKNMLVLLEQNEYAEPTEIQQKTIPLILAGQDIMASAQTGSGKTAAFAVPVIENLLRTGHNGVKNPRCLVLAPTRELALQVQSQFQRFSKNSRIRSAAIYGGTGYGQQIKDLRRGVDVVVATPGRLFDHMEQGSIDISMVEVLILDEADRMLDMGFMPQVRKIISRISSDRQTLMFSATIDRRVEDIARQYLRNPATIRVNTKQLEPQDIEQRIIHVSEMGKDAMLLELIQGTEMESVLIFTRTRRKASKVRSRLRASNVSAEEIHSDISQNQRERTLKRYRNGEFSVLVATDIAARGLDIPSITHVVNYDLPDSAADYVHRIGRTGRAGRSGVALSFVSEEQRYLIRDIERVTGRQLDPDYKPKGKVVTKRRFKPRRRRVG
jgi:ATP-dependent RNA helicase RhlE